MAGVLDRTLGIFELLATHAEGLPLATIADRLNMPRSAAHRLLGELSSAGYVRQVRDRSDYALTTKLVSLGLTFLGSSGIVDLAQPVLDRVAHETGELVRLSIIDGERLTWVAKAQGARSGLRYDPEMGMDVQLSCTASGHAWLLTMSDEEALRLVAKQGFGQPETFGPNAPTTAMALLDALREDRKRGFSVTIETHTLGMAAMAAPIRHVKHSVIGVISIAGPHFRLPEERMLALGPLLLGAADELGAASTISPIFQSSRTSYAS